jgi:acetyl-CoA carboxylase biotin carboxyl carrier protein
MSNTIDTKIINKLAEILDKNQLTNLKYEDESCKISLTREGVVPVYSACAPAPVVMPAQPVVQPSAPTEEKPITNDEDYSNSPNAVKSPMVGVVYLASNPNAPAYVNVGDTVSAGDTICLIEAMKTYNPVKAHKSGTVTKILVEAGDPVEYGEPLIIIE